MMNRFVTIFFVHAVLCLSTNCLSQAKTSNENLSPEFTGQKYFESSGLYYFNNRYYDPALGRFLTPDPLQQYASPYSYADGDPLGRVDPSGLIFERLAELASSAFRALTSCCRGGATDEVLGERYELRVRPDNGHESITQGQRRSIRVVQQSVSQSPSTNSITSRSIGEGSIQPESVSQSPSANSITSRSTGEGSIQPAFDFENLPPLMDRVLAVDNYYPERMLELDQKTRVSLNAEGGGMIYVETVSLDGRSRSINSYSKHLMIFGVNEGDWLYFNKNDVIRNQWIQAAREGNFSNPPREFRLGYIDSIDDDTMQRVLNDFGLQVLDTAHDDDRIASYHVGPNPQPISVDRLQKINQHLNLRLNSDEDN